MFRPEAIARLARWKEPILIGLVLVFALRQFWQAVTLGSWISGFIGLVLIAIIGSLLYVSYLRARLRRDVTAPGIVEINEQNISYFGPTTGGEVELSNITRIQISTLPSTMGDRNWIIWHSGGSLVIPVAAQGADQLLEVLTALPGFRYDTTLKAIEADAREIFTIWSLRP